MKVPGAFRKMKKNELIVAQEKIKTVRDLSDFCAFWPDIKIVLSRQLASGHALDEDARKILHWLTLLADKTFVSDQD